MNRVLRIPGRKIDDDSFALGQTDLGADELRAAGFEVELDGVVDVSQSRDGGFEDFELAPGWISPPATAATPSRSARGAARAGPARGASKARPPREAGEASARRRVCQVELESGARLWLRPDSLYEMFGQRPTRGALPPADQAVWQINPVVAPVSGTRGGVLDRIVKVVNWVVKGPVLGGAKGVLVGHPVYNLAKAIEDQQHEGRKCGLYALSLSASEPTLTPHKGKLEALKDKPLLVFLHGTLSSTVGSFGGLWEPDNAAGLELRRSLATLYGDRVYALEHYTLIDSPVANALVLADALPEGARVHLVSHSRGGLVGELMCLAGVKNRSEFSAKALASLLHAKATDPAVPMADEVRRYWQQQRDDTERLIEQLLASKVRIERFARVACPSQGTSLAMRQIDVWLSLYKCFIDKSAEGLALKFFPPAIALRALVGLVSQPDASDRLPGLWAMVPGNPLVSLLNLQALEVSADLSVIAGNHAGKGALTGGLEKLLNRFFGDENDFIVNTGAMYGGLPRAAGNTRFQLANGPEVSHFRYFRNAESVRWVGAALLRADKDELSIFRALHEAPKKAPPLRAVLKPRPAGPRPIVFVLPGIMGSELAAKGENIWLHYGRIALGRIGELAIDEAEVAATRPLPDYYSELLDYLAESHDVQPFAYDWRRSMFDAAARLARQIATTLDAQERSATPMPVRIVAHSLGGLVVRALMAAHADVWKRLCAHEGARVLMLGTPNGGSYEIVRLLLAQESTLQNLAFLDMTRNTRELLQLIKAFPGVLELLPLDGGDFFSAATWEQLRTLDEAGQGNWAMPGAHELAAARAALQRLKLDDKDARRILYVAGTAEQTPSGWVEDFQWDYGRSGTPGKTIAFTSSPRGDGSVLWETGIPPQVAAWYMPGVGHSELCNAPEHFPALVDLLESGNTTRLAKTPPATRAAADTAGAGLIRRDIVTEHPSARGTPGGLGVLDRPAKRHQRRAARKPLPDKTRVQITHGDLAYARFPVVIGHYAGDTLVGAEAVLNNRLDGALARRSQLGLYAGAAGTATVELQAAHTGARRAGAVVIGLGRPDALTPGSLREGMTRAALEYALALVNDQLRSPPAAAGQDGGPIKAQLSCLLVGSGGASGLTVRNVILALLGGIGAANRRLAEHDLANRVWIDEVEFLELWLDRATQAAEALELALKEGEIADLFMLGDPGGGEGGRALVQGGQGGLHRIDFAEAPAWWQRMEVSYDARLNQLRYVAMGERARAEEMLVSGQMETAERFIEDAIGNASRDAEVSRTLFEMLVPNRLKDMAPDQQDVWLLVDERSGEFPWELLEDRWSRDGKPVAVAAGMLRQFKTIEFRERPAMAMGDAALVIGNPVLPSRDDFPFLELPGAQQEAENVAALLESHRFEVTRQIQTEPSQIFAKLHGKDYRILHLAGHGVHDWPVKRLRPPADHPEGEPEEIEEPVSGMLVGDGVFLTPGDIEQMRFVPELVFINCCHLGRLSSKGKKAPWRMGNKLAANLAAQFIRMGVRAVVAAGWEVDDAAALTFATSFYDQLLSGLAFGAAVKQAREVTYLQHGGTNTWGAFQCYGDPNWQLRPRAQPRGDQEPSALRSPAHAAVELENLRARLRMGQGSAALALDARLRQLRAQHAPWLATDAAVAAAAGLALGEVERFDEAIKLLDTAAASGNALVSLKAIEQRANFMVKKALKEALAEGAGKEQVDAAVQAMGQACADLTALLRFGETDERRNLLGSAWKRQSWIAPDAKMRARALRLSHEAYRRANKLKNKPDKVAQAYPITNMVAMRALLRWFALDKSESHDDADRLLVDARTWAQDREAKNPDFWSAVADADCKVAAMLLDEPDAASIEHAREAYRGAVRSASKKELGSVREQIDYLIHMARLAKKASHVEALQAIRQVLG